jgi:hypothetical protein
MAVVELFSSRRQHETIDGDTLELHFKALWTDWDARIGTPRVGMPVTEFIQAGSRYDDLICSDVQIDAIDNEYCSIIALFSTDNAEERPIAKEPKSWQLLIDVNTQENEAVVFYDYNAQEYKYWKDHWKANRPVELA